MKFHEELNPVIWDRFKEKRIGGAVRYQLKPEVADKLKEIANAFIESLEIPLDAVTDCVITGSSASYNYTPYSDIDLHLKVDFDKVHEDCPLVKGYLNAIKAAFNSSHDIHIHGIPVEVYAEGINEDTVHNGLYSLWQGKWIDEPQKIPPTENDAAVNAKFKEIAEQIDQIEDSELAVELLSKVYEMRKAGLAEAGEFSTENLAFKKLRNEGYLQKLRDIKKAKIDQELSLEKRTESTDKVWYELYLPSDTNPDESEFYEEYVSLVDARKATKDAMKEFGYSKFYLYKMKPDWKRPQYCDTLTLDMFDESIEIDSDVLAVLGE